MRRLLSGIFICSPVILAAQGNNELWTSTATRVELTRDLKLKVEEGIRFTNGFVDQTYTDISTEYKFNKYFEASFTWRNGQRSGFWDAENIDNRFVLDLSPGYELADWTFILRFRGQARYRDLTTSKFGYIPDKKLRIRFAVRYDWINKTDFEIGIEDYLSIHPEGNYFDTYRFYAGVRKGFSDYHRIEFNYIYQSEIQVRRPAFSHILSMAYSFDLAEYYSDRKKRIEEAKPDKKINWYLVPY